VFVPYFNPLLNAAVSNGSSIAWNALVNCNVYGRSLLEILCCRHWKGWRKQGKVRLLVFWHVSGQDMYIRQKRCHLKQFAQITFVIWRINWRLYFHISLTVHLSITLANDQLDAQIFYTFITVLYMWHLYIMGLLMGIQPADSAERRLKQCCILFAAAMHWLVSATTFLGIRLSNQNI